MTLGQPKMVSTSPQPHEHSPVSPTRAYLRCARYGSRFSAVYDSRHRTWTGITRLGKTAGLPVPVSFPKCAEWLLDEDERKLKECCQVLSQVHFYMDRWGCRYGGVLTGPCGCGEDLGEHRAKFLWAYRDIRSNSLGLSLSA